jgi:hypothetical protein
VILLVALLVLITTVFNKTVFSKGGGL